MQAHPCDSKIIVETIHGCWSWWPARSRQLHIMDETQNLRAAEYYSGINVSHKHGLITHLCYFWGEKTRKGINVSGFLQALLPYSLVKRMLHQTKRIGFPVICLEWHCSAYLDALFYHQSKLVVVQYERDR